MYLQYEFKNSNDKFYFVLNATCIFDTFGDIEEGYSLSSIWNHK